MKESPFGTHRDTLQRLLNGRADIVVELEELVQWYRDGKRDGFPAGLGLDGPGRVDRRAVTEWTRLRKSIAALERQCQVVRARYTKGRHAAACLDNGFWMSQNQSDTARRGASETLRQVHDATVALRGGFEWWDRQESLRRGRPKNHAKRWLAAATVRIIGRADVGIQIHKGREGKLAPIMRIVLRAAGEPTARDLLDTLNEAVDEWRAAGLVSGGLNPQPT